MYVNKNTVKLIRIVKYWLTLYDWKMDNWIINTVHTNQRLEINNNVGIVSWSSKVFVAYYRL